MICLLAGTYEVYETIRSSKQVVLRPLGEPHSVVLDGMGVSQILSTGQQPLTVKDITFINAAGSTGGGQCVPTRENRYLG